MNPKFQALAEESVASIRDIQKNPSRALRGMTRVVRGSKTVGFFFSNEQLEEFIEDVEAFNSPTLQASIKKSRREMKDRKTIPLNVVAKEYGL
jgi:hypothetical protein